MVKLSEVKLTIATAIAAAFGFIIALIWKEIIVGIFAYFDLEISNLDSLGGIGIAVITGIIITLLSVLGILYISKWGGVGKK
ncbi:MAG: hypothetical protein JSW62_02235 [Thermoplasmatales archaeon]|nr:MAG: hypothetical protein JSW62_02235 [Thermoplasmatales archaeon]